MPRYKVTDPETGKVLHLVGETPPTQQDVAEIFSKRGEVRSSKVEEGPLSPMRRYLPSVARAVDITKEQQELLFTSLVAQT